MPVDSAADLVNALRQSRLLAPSQMEELTGVLQQRYTDSRALARALLERDWLTPYQLNQLLQGGTQNLILGPYIILQRLGDGVLGQVYKARHQHMKRLVSLTIVREELLSQPTAVQRFYQEIQAASQLSHGNVVHAYDAGPIGRTHFFALEYVEGIDLERLVHQSGPLPVLAACTFIRQAARGLQHAFERGLLHHDLRPVNLLVTRFAGQGDTVTHTGKTPPPAPEKLSEAQLKICNLGLTMLQPRLRNATDGVGVDGSPDFLAPEQTGSSRRSLDIRSDMYSLGCIFYYLLAGKVPFPGDDPTLKLHQHQEEEPPQIEAMRRDVPPEVSAIVRKLMAKQPDDRYQTPAELAEAVAAWGEPDGSSSEVRRPTAVKNKGKVVAKKLDKPDKLAKPEPKEARLWPLITGVVVALIGVTVGLAYLLPGSGDRQDQGAKSESTDTRPGVLPYPSYHKKATREETILATLEASGYPTLQGKWWYIGPFDNDDKWKGFKAEYPPEKEIDLKKSYPGKDNTPAVWKEYPDFRPGRVQNLRLFDKHKEWAVVYLYHEIEVKVPVSLFVSLGSDDTLTIWLNRKLLLANNVQRGAAPDGDFTTLDLQHGKNQLLVKVCQGTGDWAFYIMPRWPERLETAFGGNLSRDFPSKPPK